MADRPRPASEGAKRPFFGWATSRSSALLTDLYQLTMMQAYLRRGMLEQASFELFVRHLPPQRRYLVAAGLEQALAYLEGLRFARDDLDRLRSSGELDDDFIAWLAKLRFTGEVWAIPEGEVVYTNEPLLRVTAPLPEAQLVETFLLNTMLFQTMIASKASRVVTSAGGRAVVDFGTRRAHGADASIKAARAAYVAGCAATSNVLASALYGIPASGTMAHSYVMAVDGDEERAFLWWAEQYGARSAFLVDTYDTVEGARHAVRAAREAGVVPGAVRLDSGDIVGLARAVRATLDQGGLQATRIFASGDLNEHRVAEIVAAGAPVDGFGVGTEMTTSADAPSLSGVYKLVEYAGRPRAKRSPAKATFGGKKQVWRTAAGDVLAREGEAIDGRPLLERVMSRGRARGTIPSLEAISERRAAAVNALSPNRLLLADDDAPVGPRLDPSIERP